MVAIARGTVDPDQLRDVRDAEALLTVPAEDGLAVHVLDAGGKVMATGEVAAQGGPPVPVDRHED